MTIWDRPNDDILAAFEEASEHSSTGRSYRSRIQSSLRRYRDAHGHEPALRDVIADAELLAEMFALDDSLTFSGKIARATVGRTITAFRSLVAKLPPPGLTAYAIEGIFEAARRTVSRVNGSRLHLTAGTKRDVHRGWAPSADDISSLIEELRAATTSLSAMAADVVAVLYLTGARVGAILGLVADDLAWMPDGRVWAHVHEKARPDDRPLLLRIERAETRERFRLLAPSESLWADGGRQLSYQVLRQRLISASARAGLPRIRPHDLRRAFASDVAAMQGLRATQRAGGWLAEAVTERYLHPRSLP